MFIYFFAYLHTWLQKRFSPRNAAVSTRLSRYKRHAQVQQGRRVRMFLPSPATDRRRDI